MSIGEQITILVQLASTEVLGKWAGATGFETIAIQSSLL